MSGKLRRLLVGPAQTVYSESRVAVAAGNCRASLGLDCRGRPSLRKPERGRAPSPHEPCQHTSLCRLHSQHHPKAGAATDHLVVGFGSFFEREFLNHRTDSGQGAELHRVFGICRDAGGPSVDRLAAGDQLQWRYGDGVWAGTDHEQGASAGQPVHQGGNRLGIWRGGENHLGASECLQCGGGITSGGVYVVSGAEFSGERFFVLAPADGKRAEAHLPRILDSQMAQSADALNGDQIASARARIAQRIENGDAGTKQRGGLGGVQVFGDGGDGFGGREHIFLVTAIVADAGDLPVLAVNEVASAAGIAGEAMAAVPSDSHAMAGFPVGDVGADGVDAPGNFVAGNAWILNAGPMAFLYECVAVADAAGFDFNSDLIAGGFGDGSFYELEITAGFADLDSLHL